MLQNRIKETPADTYHQQYTSPDGLRDIDRNFVDVNLNLYDIVLLSTTIYICQLYYFSGSSHLDMY